MALTSINPATGEIIQSVEEQTDTELDQALATGDLAFLGWKQACWDHRRNLMNTAAILLPERKDHHARVMADEMGKPLAQGLAETEKCAWACEYFAANAEAFLANQPQINRIVHDSVSRFRGSISAEHGIGQLRRDELLRYKSPLEMAVVSSMPLLRSITVV